MLGSGGCRGIGCPLPLHRAGVVMLAMIGVRYVEPVVA
jgi:hypothetical protein